MAEQFKKDPVAAMEEAESAAENALEDYMYAVESRATLRWIEENRNHTSSNEEAYLVDWIRRERKRREDSARRVELSSRVFQWLAQGS